MTKTLTIRLDENEALQLEKLIKITGEKTASKAIIESIYSLPDILDKNDELHILLDEAQNEINRLNQIIEIARDSAIALAQNVSQNDIFTDLKSNAG